MERKTPSNEPDFEELRRRVYRLCLALLGCEASAADATQEALTRAWLRRGRKRADVSWWTWTCGFAVRVCRESGRESGGGAFHEFDALPSIRDAASDTDAERLASVYRSIQQLPPRQREVLTLRYLLERPLAEIAVILECPEGTVKSNLHKALVNLQSAARKAERHDV